MFADATLTFNSALGTPQAISATAASAGLVDVTGAGSGNAPSMIGGYPQVNTAMGLDMGIGDGEATPWVVITVATAGTGAGTVTFELQAAPDNGSYSPGSYTTIFQTQAYTGTALTAGTVIAFPVPPYSLSGTAEPRFYRIDYVVSGSATVSVLANIVLNAPSSLKGIQFSNNYLAV